MKKEPTVFEILSNIKRRPFGYIFQVTPETLKVFLDGFKLGYFASNQEVNSNYYVDYWIETVESRGWRPNNVDFTKQMYEKGMTDIEIMNELMSIEIEIWLMLEQGESKIVH